MSQRRGATGLYWEARDADDRPITHRSRPLKEDADSSALAPRRRIPDQSRGCGRARLPKLTGHPGPGQGKHRALALHPAEPPAGDQQARAGTCRPAAEKSPGCRRKRRGRARGRVPRAPCPPTWKSQSPPHPHTSPGQTRSCDHAWAPGTPEGREEPGTQGSPQFPCSAPLRPPEGASVPPGPAALFGDPRCPAAASVSVPPLPD